MGFIVLYLHVTILVGMTRVPTQLNSRRKERRKERGVQKGEEGKPRVSNPRLPPRGLQHTTVHFGYTKATQVQKLMQTRISQKCKCIIHLRTGKSWLEMQ